MAGALFHMDAANVSRLPLTPRLTMEGLAGPNQVPIPSAVERKVIVRYLIGRP
jgi:hypothetical protein